MYYEDILKNEHLSDMKKRHTCTRSEWDLQWFITENVQTDMLPIF